jgi:hypothetical protein
VQPVSDRLGAIVESGSVQLGPEYQDPGTDLLGGGVR